MGAVSGEEYSLAFQVCPFRVLVSTDLVYFLVPLIPLKGEYHMTSNMLEEKRSREGPNHTTSNIKG